MSYSDYHYLSSGTSYDSYSQHYDTSQSYTSGDQHGQFAQYEYTSSQSLDQYAQPAASVPTDYTGFVEDTGYTSTPVTSYPESSGDQTPYQYSQNTDKIDQFTSRSSILSDGASHSFSTPVSHYVSDITIEDQTSDPPVTDYSSYDYHPTEYNEPTSSYGQESTTSAYSETYNQNNSGYSYQDTPSQVPNTWTSSSDQYISYDAGYGGSTSSKSYNQKVESGYGNTDYSPSVDRYSQSSSSESGVSGYSQPENYFRSNDYSHNLGYVKPVSCQVSKPKYDFGGYTSSSRFDKGFESINRGSGRSYSSEKGGSLGVASFSSSNFSSSGGRGDFQGDRSNVTTRGGSNRYSYGKNSSFPTQTTTTQRSFNNPSGGRSSFGGSLSNRGNRDGGFSSRGSFPSTNHGDRHSTVSKPPLSTFDARNKINESRSGGMISNKIQTPVSAQSKNKVTASPYKPAETTEKDIFKVPASPYKQPEATKKEVFKAPSRPQDRLLNEIEEKEKAQRAEELKKSEEEQKKAEEKRLKMLEEEKKQAEEAMRKKAAELAVKAAPPSKPPETPEEIAHEEEIQRKIRESLVIISPEQEIAVLKKDPTQDIEMSEELRKLLKTLTTDYFCKLCNVRIVGLQMVAMHYNGKNHSRKVRNFVQSGGRSAGFNLESPDESVKGEQKEGAGEKKTEIVEITNMEENRYCKICKVFFIHDDQSELHYKGKSHAKKMKNIGAENRPEAFECKICCITVTAQEHLTAHLNGAKHKLQIRKLDTTEIFREGGLRGRGRGLGYRGRGRGGRGAGKVNDGGDWRPLPDEKNFRGKGFRGRGHVGGDVSWRGAGFKRRGGFDDGQPYRGGFGPQFPKRPRF